MTLIATTSASSIALATAASALAFPPTTSALIPASWSANGVIAEFDLEIWSSGSLSLTAAELFGGKLATLVVADTTFTAVHGTEIFTAAGHGLLNGDGPFRLTNSGGALPAGLAVDTDYWIIYIDANTFYLAASLADALVGAANKVLITGNGTGTHTFSDVVGSTKRVRWYSHGALTATIALTAQRAFVVRCGHRPEVIAYALTGTLSAGTVSASVIPVMEI